MFTKNHTLFIGILVFAFLVGSAFYVGLTTGPESRIEEVFSKADYEKYCELKSHIEWQCMSLEYGEERDRAIKEAMERRNALIEKYRDKLGPDFKVRWNLLYSI